MINLAVGLLPEESRRSVCDYPSEAVILPPHFDQTVLDPFCGGGTILQEALLMGYDVFGTDLDPRMVEYAKANVMDWLKQQNHPQLKAELTINQADAASFVWPKASFNFIASETALGKPYSSPPSPGDLAKTLSDCSQLIKQFLKNLASQTEPGTRLCLAVPAWQIKPNQFKYLPLIDQISELGYNQVRFKHISDEDLLYFRSHQIVARKLLVLIRK